MAVWIMSKLPLSIKSFWEFVEVSDPSGNPPCDSAENCDGEPLAGGYRYGQVVKSIGCSSRGLKVHSWHPYQVAYNHP